LIDSAVLFMADSTVYIAKNLPLRKLVMSVNGHYIMRFWFLPASIDKFQYLRGNSKGCCNDVLSVQHHMMDMELLSIGCCFWNLLRGFPGTSDGLAWGSWVAPGRWRMGKLRSRLLCDVLLELRCGTSRKLIADPKVLQNR
jgi:hypothetical protein